MKYKDKGPKVQTLQENLMILDFKISAADGQYGKKTRKAVKRFQKNFQLKADGIAGAKTVGWLDLVIAEKTKDRQYINADKFDHVMDLISRLPAKDPDFFKQEDVEEYLAAAERGETVIIAIRKGNTINRYDDSIFVLRILNNGDRYIREYQGTTDPGKHTDYDGANVSILVQQIIRYKKWYHCGKLFQMCLGDTKTKYVRYRQKRIMGKTPSIRDLIYAGCQVFFKAVGHNMHYGTEVFGGTSKRNKIGKYSRGCNVFNCPEKGKWARSKTYLSFLVDTFFRKGQEEFLAIVVDEANMRT